MENSFASSGYDWDIKRNISDQSKYSDCINRLAESMKEICHYAEKNNVLVVLEPINRYENNYLNTVEKTADFICKYDIPMTKILVDTFHMNIEEADMNNSLRKYSELIGYVHIADSNRMYPGAGHVDFKQIINTLKDINYKGYLSAECLPVPSGETAVEKWIYNVKTYLNINRKPKKI